MTPFITYRVVEDRDGKLEAAARLACNFWNHHVEPERPIVIHVDLFWSPLRYIARSYEPERRGNVTHGRIRFNSVYVRRYSELQLAGTLAHELGHTLGFGWDRWLALFDAATGQFTADAIARLPALAQMRVETDHGEATRHLHWDEHRHGGELMTGFENQAEHVLPVTIDVTALLGHRVRRRLEARTPVATVLTRLAGEPFTRKDDARQLAAVDFRPGRILERIFERLPGGTLPIRIPPRPQARGPRKTKRSSR